jgi:hypothetical protein
MSVPFPSSIGGLSSFDTSIRPRFAYFAKDYIEEALLNFKWVERHAD